MKYFIKNIFLFIYLFTSVNCNAFSPDSLSVGTLPDSLVNHVVFEKAGTSTFLQFNTGDEDEDTLQKNQHAWLYFNYDIPTIKLTNKKDTGYKVIFQNYVLEKGKLISENRLSKMGFESNAWYKLYFKVTPELTHKIFSLNFSFMGAMEIYLDGNLIANLGKIDKKGNSTHQIIGYNEEATFSVPDTLIHSISIRYVFTDYVKFDSKYQGQIESPYFKLYQLDTSNQKNNIVSIIISICNMLSSFFFALFLLHLLIYLFYKEKSFNLLYSLFLFLLSLSFLEVYVLQFIKNVELYLWVDNADKVIFPTVCFLLVTILNKFLNEKPSWHYKGLIILALFLYLDVFFFHFMEGLVITTIIFYTYFNTLAHSIKGIKRKVASAKFLGWGILGFTLSFVFLIILSIGITMISIDATVKPLAIAVYVFLIIFGVLCIPLSMSAYLAYDFARTNKSLSKKLKENQILSEKSLKHEKEKQEILANQNKMLEEQVNQRTKEIACQNKLLEHQKKEITDSITYAKRIQQALLPELGEIKSKLPNSFIFYLPKDIVSGDFYFFQTFNTISNHPGRAEAEGENGIYIAAADCTGHGVPGALMSMIVHEKLEAATKIYNQPKDILKSINKQVKDALKQYQNENASRDGCDIAFLKMVQNKLFYSGAYRPLYFFDKAGTFNEIKPTKTAIAGLTPYDQEFDQVELDTNNLKAVYVFSDGFADQFGGDKVKKLTTKKFKELLAQLVNMPVEQQHSELERFFTSWKSNGEQIDDVLVIGITF